MLDGADSLLWGDTDGRRRNLHGRSAITRDRHGVIKYPKSLCEMCNTSRSRALDLAYDEFSLAVRRTRRGSRKLTCAGDRLTVRQHSKLQEILRADIELAVPWGIKEHVRQLLAARDTPSFQRSPSKNPGSASTSSPARRIVIEDRSNGEALVVDVPRSWSLALVPLRYRSIG